MTYQFENDRTGKSDNVRAFLFYISKISCTRTESSLNYVVSRANGKNIQLPAYFSFDYVKTLLAAKGKFIPEFIVDLIAAYYGIDPGRLLNYSPLREMELVERDRKIAAAQVKEKTSELLTIWAAVPDLEKGNLLQQIIGYADGCKSKPDRQKVLQELSGSSCTVIDITRHLSRV